MGEAHAEWHLLPLHVLYEILGWFAFVSWSCSFYPQVILNFIRKSVVGLNLDYILLNLSKHTFYLLYNACMYFIPLVQRQYRERYGVSELIPVGPSDVAYSVHAVLFTGVTAYQILIYEKGTQRMSMITVGISGASWFAAALCAIVAWAQGQWFWLVSNFNSIQVAITFIKYIPQVLMNYKRKSTVGYSIENILLDLCGGSANIVQMGVQSIDQGSIDNFLGDNGKLLFSIVVLVFDSIFVVQHYILYCQPDKMYSTLDSKQNEEAKVEGDNIDVQRSEDNLMFSGRRFIRISNSFSDLSECFPDKMYNILDSKQNEEAKVEGDNIDVQSSEDSRMFSGRCFIRISDGFFDLSERSPDKMYSILDSKQNEEAKVERDNIDGQSSEDNQIFSGRCFIRISDRFSDLSEHFPDNMYSILHSKQNQEAKAGEDNIDAQSSEEPVFSGRCFH